MEPNLYFLAPQLQCIAKSVAKRLKNIYIYIYIFCIHTTFISLLTSVSPNVHHAFTLLLVVIVFWWLNEILFYCSIYIILLC